MSEKLKPNFTPIPNVILDEIMRTLAPGATKVLFAICRYTYGWGKPDGDRVSLKQLQDITGMAHGSVVRSLKELGAIVIVTAGDPSRQLASHYRINVEISDDDLVSLRDQSLVSKRDQASLLASLIKRPSKDNQRKKNNSVRTKRTRNDVDSDPRVKSLLTAFVEKYLARVGSPYVVKPGKDPKLLKDLLRAGHDVPVLEAAMDRYFVHDFYSKTGFDVGRFFNAFNALNSASARKPYNPEEKGMFPTA